MGGSPSGKSDTSTPGYEQMHTDFHAYLLTGHAGDDTAGYFNLEPDAEGFAQPEKLRGVTKAFNDILSYNLGGTPYSEAEFYAATDSTEPLYRLLDKIEDFVTELETNDPTTDWESHWTSVTAKVLETTSVNDAVNAFESEQENVLQRSIGRVNSSFSDIDAVNSSSRVLSVTLLERDHDKSVANYRANLKLGREEAAINTSSALVEQDRRSEVSRINALSNFMNGTNLYIAAARNELEDELRLDIEDTLWDLKAYEMPAKVFESITGATMVPVSGKSEQKSGGGLATALGVAAVGASFLIGSGDAGAAATMAIA
jgi:hypothetical protein